MASINTVIATHSYIIFPGNYTKSDEGKRKASRAY